MVGRIFGLARRGVQLAQMLESRTATWFSRFVESNDSRMRRREAGMATAEYAVGTVAAAAFAVVLYKIVTGGQVSSLVTAIVRRALTSLA
jgi:Protein of unknown function (DUF4244)